ncbi:lachesin-like [Anneissia japonica]|uniref:lachesin-like n=1 Tax=Anneissia japonica TaxID=1529436 RepID=UPI0014255E5B|nr:lachesin-like [Anneissia japonica]
MPWRNGKGTPIRLQGNRQILNGSTFPATVADIVTEATETWLWVIEGKRIELPAAQDADNLSSASIHSVNWFNGVKVDVHNIIVSLSSPNQGRFSIDFTDQTIGDLIIEPVYRRDTGYYTCQIVEKDVTTVWQHIFHLQVYYMNSPSIILEVGKNNNVYFFCNWLIIYPDIQPNVTWLLDGRKINITPTKYILKEKYRKKTLWILNATSCDLGNYSCSITIDTNRGPMTEVSKESAELTRGIVFEPEVDCFTAPANSMDLDKPVITVSNSSVYEGNSFTLTCSINANPPTPTQVTWLKDNIIITHNCSRYEIYEDFKILRVPVASVNESGNYQCRVENEVHVEGKTSFNLNISVIKFCVPDLQYKISTMVLIFTTFAAIIFGSLPTCLMCYYIRKKKEREFHLQYQNAYYQALSNRPTPAVYNELNKVNDNAYSTTKNDANATSAAVDETRTKVDPIYENVKA